MYLQDLTKKILGGTQITREEAISLLDSDLEELRRAADEIRAHFCGDAFDLCVIINGKSGKCSENCKYCAQSAHYPTCVEEYPLLDTNTIVKDAVRQYNRGVLRYSIVCSGRTQSDAEVDSLCESIRAIKQACPIAVCISLGLLNIEQFRKLKDAGAQRVHNNLESSRRYFPEVCTTHTYEDKLRSIRAAQSVGLEVCSGGIAGLGETPEDRIDMFLMARELGVTSFPLNFLNPIPNTPFAHNRILTHEEMLRTACIGRFILPKAMLRLAGGRGLMPDKGEALFCSGVNAAISGDMLTTAGVTVETDKELLTRLGYEIKFFAEEGK